MKRLLLTSLILHGALNVAHAGENKVTGDQALASSASNKLASVSGFNGTSVYATLPRESGTGSISEHTLTIGRNQIKEIGLRDTSNYVCGLSAYNQRSYAPPNGHLLDANVSVYQRNGYWYLGGNANSFIDISAKATCSEK